MGIEEHITPGRMLYLTVCFPHNNVKGDKYFVIVAVSDFPLLLKINSSGKQTELGKKFKELQFKIKKSDYGFLDHDSYLDCGTVWEKLLSKDEIIEQLTTDPSRIKGDLLAGHRNEIIRLTSKSKSINSRNKRAIAEELKQ